MKSYNEFARVYDFLMKQDVDYEKWADYIEDIFKKYKKHPSLVCELACGTGNITIPLARRGYNMTGVDASGEMLNTALSKSRELDILFLNQRMENLDLYGTMDAFLCMIDGINYILSPMSLRHIFTRMKTCFMNPGALFIFDISTRHKLQNVIGSNTFIHSEREIFYTWQNRYLNEKNISDMLLTFFSRQPNGSYTRFEERHVQRAYTADELTEILSLSGFKNIDLYDALTFEKPHKTSERIVFVCS